MNTDQLETLRAAVLVKLGEEIHADGIRALRRGLPQRHAVEWPLTEAADFVLRQFATGETETVFVRKQGASAVLHDGEHSDPWRTAPGASVVTDDKLREDTP